MPDVTLEMEGVYKKFRKGEKFDSLRDFIPALFTGFLGRRNGNPLKKQEFWALSDISFQMKKGEALGIIGGNGAGKSTILKLLTKIMDPTRGQIITNGRLSSLIEVGAGFHPDLTGRENVFLNGAIVGMKRSEIKARFDSIVEFSGLEDFIDTPVKRYSSGMYARLGFSVSAHLEPDILVIDEVLSVGDYAFQTKCAQKMKSSIRDGVTLVFVSHNLKAISEVCPQCIFLEKGKIVKKGPTNEVVAYYLERASNRDEEKTEKEVVISDVTFQGENGSGPQYEAGDKLRIDVELTGKIPSKKLSVSVTVVDERQYQVFNTSTERLTQKTFSLSPGEKKKISFELTLHLAPGTYFVSTYVIRYDLDKIYDGRVPAATIYMRSDCDVKGSAHLYPELTADPGFGN